ncbi:hypothetical protein K8I85_09480 [bacterium]|nr:hypothetical protein [bacterium]
MKDQFFAVDEHDDITTVGFHRGERPAGADLSRIQGLWALLDAQKARASKVLVLRAPADLLTPSNLDAFLNTALAESEAVSLNRRSARADAARLYLTREENAFCRFIQQVQHIDAFVIGVLQGEVDLPFLGLALACDYRIVADDTVFVSRCLELGVPPVGALPWFLTRYLGHGMASRILLGCEPIRADRARDLGLVNEVVPLKDLERCVSEVATGFASKRRSALVATKRTLAATEGTLAEYLDEERRQHARCAREIASSRPVGGRPSASRSAGSGRVQVRARGSLEE